ncbi:MAG: HEAT repeat domain-containing protein [Planctomycetaceae bacterium]|nr:HEAT repeat domain-containing protein [Planctomycetaceae bacterium]
MLRVDSRFSRLIVCAFAALIGSTSFADSPVRLEQGDHVVIVGNTLAERMQYFGAFETLLHSRFPELQLVVRNLGWSADELTLRPRSKDFVDHGHTLADHKPNVLIAMFGFNESFAGPSGVAKFEADLERFLAAPQELDQYAGLRSQWDKREDKPIDRAKLESLRQIVLVSPLAHENLDDPSLPDGAARNDVLKLYVDAMRRIANKRGVPFVDLFAASQELMANAGSQKLTINGVHLNAHGDQLIGAALDEALFGPRPAPNGAVDLEKLHAEVQEKNLQFFYDYRAINGFYIYGGRKQPFGVVNFPAEFAKLRKMTAVRDRRIWDVAQGKSVDDHIDDSGTGEFARIETNFKNPIVITSPADAAATFELPAGYAINLFASEEDFPDLANPVQFTFDSRGRLWVTTMQSYPMYLPGTPVDDKILILEDTDGDGRADKQTVFADKLHVPTGIEFGRGGVFVAQQPNLMFLKDVDGDDRADVRELVLHGFDSADSHHSISAFTYDQGGALYFEEGTFHHTQVETPYGPRRCANAGVFRWEPRTWRFDVFVSYGFANPWGHVVDSWGQNFIADASPGANYVGAAFSGDVDYPNKHGNLKQFLTKQWRPTAGCELVSSRNFPPESQGNYLLNNCIGFQGVLQYKLREDGAGFAADPVDPLVRSTDPNFRPVDIEFGPDGALYLCDWFNPLVGHMQHNLRDPNRDQKHGRIWRVVYTKNPLVQAPPIADEPIAALLALLMSEPEERTRYRVRMELWNRDTDDVLAELGSWIAGLAADDPNREHHLLEALWLRQAHDVVDEKLLTQLLRSPEPKARAAATRVLCYWRDRVGDPIALLRRQAADEHPRVRLEAVRALSFFREQAAVEAAVESLIYEQDDYLKYTLDETLKTLELRLDGATTVPDNPTDREKRSAAAEKRRGEPESVAPVVPRKGTGRAKP